MNEAHKLDGGKNRLDLIDPVWIEEVGRVLTFGAGKYQDWNWARGMNWSRTIAATLRHVFAMMRGEDRDPETGLLHSAHASACLMFLTNYMLTGTGKDDRWKQQKPVTILAEYPENPLSKAATVPWPP